jgi:hypothetical protein
MLLQQLSAALGQLLQCASPLSFSNNPIMSPSSDEIHRNSGAIDFAGEIERIKDMTADLT